MRKTFCIIGISLLAAIAGAEPLNRHLDIFPLQELHTHGSSIVECPNGDLLACWFQGSGERTADDVVVNGARLKKGASQWSPVFLMADTPGFPDCNPVLFVDAKERLWMFWVAVQAHRWECSLLKYRRADRCGDDGAPVWSWQDAILLEPGDAFAEAMKKGFDGLDLDEGMWAEYAHPYTAMLIEAAKDPWKRQAGWMTRIHPLTLPSGRILLPLYSDGFNACLMAISDDMGETWRPSLPIIGLAPIQPTLVRKRDGGIVAYLRDSGDAPYRVLISSSADEGESWTTAVDTDIPNPGSSIDAIALEDGCWVMILNDTEEGRHRLAAAMSDDEGVTWKWKRALEPSGDGGTSFSYPSVIQSREGLIHMTYTYNSPDGKGIRHRVLDPAWIRAVE